MPIYTFRPTNKGQERILANDVKIKATTQYGALWQVKNQYPGYNDYVLMDIEWDEINLKAVYGK